MTIQNVDMNPGRQIAILFFCNFTERFNSSLSFSGSSYTPDLVRGQSIALSG